MSTFSSKIFLLSIKIKVLVSGIIIIRSRLQFRINTCASAYEFILDLRHVRLCLPFFLSGNSLIRCYPDIVDIKPANMEELTEVITAAEFHPNSCNTFVYSSSKGTIRLCDMRASALCDRHSKCKFIMSFFPKLQYFLFVWS